MAINEGNTITTPSIGVSACLIGEKFRYDGRNKQDRYISDTLGNFFRLVPVCPEVECGMPVPREAMRLEGEPENPRLMTIKTRVDKTAQMLSFCRKKLEELEKEDLCGFIFKNNSPSSGLRAKVHNRGLRPRSGRGLFAAAMVRHFPLLPVEDEERLSDPAIRENFLERVLACRRWKDFLSERPNIGKLVEFHTAHKLLMMAHSPSVYREMGKLVACAGTMERDELLRRYEELLMKGLACPATLKKHTNVLQHVMGYFRKQLTHNEKEELLVLIGRYHDRLVPLIEPITLLRNYIEKYNEPYLHRQVYLYSPPDEPMLRNHL